MDSSSVRPQDLYSHLLSALSTLTPIFIIGGMSCVCERYTSMNGNQMMFHHFQTQHLYSHYGTCTIDGLCRIPQIMVELHICYYLDRDSTYGFSVLIVEQCTLLCTKCLHSVWRPYFTIYCTWSWPLMAYAYYAYSWTLCWYASDTSMYPSYP